MSLKRNTNRIALTAPSSALRYPGPVYLHRSIHQLEQTCRDFSSLSSSLPLSLPLSLSLSYMFISSLIASIATPFSPRGTNARPSAVAEGDKLDDLHCQLSTETMVLSDLVQE